VLLRDSQRLAALRDMQRYFDTNDATFTVYNASGSRASLDEVCERLGDLARAFEVHRIGARGALEQERLVSDDLRRKLFRPIVDIQRLRADALPRLGRIHFPWRRTNSTKLAVMARSAARVLRPHAKVFIETGLKPDFLARLRAGAAELKAAVVAKGAHRTAGVRTTRAIEQALAQARRRVNVADAFVREAVEPGSPLIAEWRSLCRAFRRPTRKSSENRGTD
jgi:hypothetical protein